MNLKPVVLSALVASLPACMATYRVSPEQYVPKAQPAQILIADNSGSVILLDGPQVVGDQLVGIENGTPDSVSIPVAQVEDAIVRHTSKGRTVALVTGLTAGVGVAVLAVATQGAGRPCQAAGNKKDFADPLGTNTCNTHAADGEN